MTQIQTTILIDLEQMGSELKTVPTSPRAPIAEMLREIQRELDRVGDDRIGAKVAISNPYPASSKSPDGFLLAGGLAITVMAASGHPVDPKKAMQILQSAWKVLKKYFSKETRVTLTYGKTKIDIAANDQDAARSLLQASAEVVNKLASSGSQNDKPTVTLTPQKR